MINYSKFGRIAAGAVITLYLAAGSVQAADITDTHLKAAREAMNAISITEPFDAILPNIAAQLKQTLIQGSPNYEAVINETVDEEAIKIAVRRADLEKEAAMIYAKAFTEQELKEIATFYSTPTGKKLLKDGPIAIRELSKAGDIWATGISRDLTKAADTALEKKIGEMEAKKNAN